MAWINFSEIKLGGGKVPYICSGCGKKRTRIVARSYHRNGFHNEDDTRAKYRKEIEVETYVLLSGQGICSKCPGREPSSRTTEIPEGWARPAPKPKPWRGPRTYLDPVADSVRFTVRTETEYIEVLHDRLVSPFTGSPLLQIPFDQKNQGFVGTEQILSAVQSWQDLQDRSAERGMA